KTLAQAQLAPYLQAHRAQFQRGLLAWLRNHPVGLDDMGQAVDALHQIVTALPEPRSLWWVACGFLEILKDNKEAEWLAAAKPLCNKIDFHMRDLAAGSHNVNEVLLRELLYAIGKSKATAPRTGEIRQLFQLDNLFPAAEQVSIGLEFNSEWLEAALYDMHSRLEALKSG